jgi:hypothetical protein
MTPCIEAPTRDQRYPRVRVEGRITYRHRLAYEEAYGPIPAGLTVDHLCFNIRCINPEHLEAVTASENTRRAWAIRMHRAGGDRPCIRGHVGNWRKQGRGWQCRDCHREQAARRRAPTWDEMRDTWRDAIEAEKREAWGR